MPASISDHEYLTLAEVSAMVGLSKRSIERCIKAGILPAYRLGRGAMRVRRDDVHLLIRRVPVASGGEG
ncbi:helix-turn-helix domain-containing protein [Sinomonas sp. B1-1]|uniref:helix-turn-helix domain-containing protein n=1 Tax=Sinomonas sp. B1-1 TaxID=3141454 RepID=UPI003D2BC543